MGLGKVGVAAAEGKGVEADLLGQHRLVQVGVVVIRRLLGVERRVGQAEERPMLVDLLLV